MQSLLLIKILIQFITDIRYCDNKISASCFIYTFRRDVLKGHHFVIKRKNETNTMLQCYLSFLSDQRKKKGTPFRGTV